MCRKCGDILENEESFNEHMSKHTSNMLSCNQCGDVFARKQQYDDHIKDHNKYTCNNCGKGFPSKRRLQLHKKDEEAAQLQTVVLDEPKIGLGKIIVLYLNTNLLKEQGKQQQKHFNNIETQLNLKTIEAKKSLFFKFLYNITLLF